MGVSIAMAAVAHQQVHYSADSPGSKRRMAQEASSPSVPTQLPVTDSIYLSKPLISHKMFTATYASTAGKIVR